MLIYIPFLVTVEESDHTYLKFQRDNSGG